MKRVFLDPSTQAWNLYTGGGNEQAEAYRQAEVVARILRERGVEVRIATAGKGDSANGYAKNVNESNATGPWDCHVSLHTDAGGATGTTAFYYPGDPKGMSLAQFIYDRLAPLSPGADHGVRARGDLYALNGTDAVAVLVEAAPHDRAESAAWIKANPEAIGKAYADGISMWLGVPLASPPATTTPIPALKPTEATMASDTDRIVAALTDISGKLTAIYDTLTPGREGVKEAGATYLAIAHPAAPLDLAAITEAVARGVAAAHTTTTGV